MDALMDFINNQMILVIVIITIITLLFIAAMFVLGRYLSRRLTGPNTALLTQGIAGRATIQEVSQTGLYINNLPQISLGLEVSVPGQAPYPATVKTVIPLINIPQFQPGVSLPVKVDPENPQNIALDIYA